MNLVVPALLFASLAAAPATEAVKLASPGLSGLNMSQEAVVFYSEHLAQQFRLAGMKVLTSGDIGAVLGLERQQQLLGCAQDATACTVELANALGVDGVIVGHLARLGSSYHLDVRVLAARDGEALGARSAKASSEEGLVTAMDEAAALLVADLYQRLGRVAAVPPAAVAPLVAAPAPPPTAPVAPSVAPVAPPMAVVAAPPADAIEAAPLVERRGAHPAWIPAVAGLVVTTAGLVVVGIGASEIYAVRDRDTGLTMPQVKSKLATNAAIADAGAWMMLAGSAAGVGAAVWRIASPRSAPLLQPSLSVGPSGAAFTVGGTLP